MSQREMPFSLAMVASFVADSLSNLLRRSVTVVSEALTKSEHFFTTQCRSTATPTFTSWCDCKDRNWSAAQRQVAHACGRAVMAVDPSLRTEDPSDHLLARLRQQIRVAVAALADQTPPRTQKLRESVTESVHDQSAVAIWRQLGGRLRARYAQHR